MPENSVAKVDNLTIAEGRPTITGSRRASTSQPGVRVARPADVHQVHRRQGKAAPEPAKGQPKPKHADYLKQCKQEYDQLKQQVMKFLVRSTWLEAEADEHGVKVTDKEAAAAFEKTRKQSFPKKADYEKFLKTSGQTEADLVYRQSVQLLEQKITREDPEGHEEGHRRGRSRSTTTRTRRSSSRSPRRVTCWSS